ncbi:MAG: metal ABC transporter ATP-binding protein [Desulfofustis sp. PB-SRB1]|jgi:ABC-type Mn2+/Zn2+ transport system ATPase subunit|nr:metal ABC transporter ATP-binding protein [Desulfofustis sp. PB-SRB1]MBM1001043.1 metal ABC transporter ATP-binding protein [Desulfofustis sp. PB-SRB1]HBH28529.1 metal ABC transporter ATP-binding protein [Desulfofustis sp.]
MTTESPYVIEVEHLTVSYHARAALLDVSVRIERDQLVGVIGPNGAGKSTFIKAILGFIKPDIGTVLINGGDAQKATGQVAYVPQRGAVDWDFPITVQEVAMMGRYQQIPWYTSPRPTDYQAAREALEMVRMEKFGERQIGELSGGQQQRVFLARALAQGSDILLLDEPFAGVDAATERAILDVLERAKEAGKTLVVVHHDLATAAEYFDKLILIKQRLYGYGTPQAVLQEDLLAKVYEGRLRIFRDVVREDAS